MKVPPGAKSLWQVLWSTGFSYMRYLINDLIIYDAELKTLSNRNFEDDFIKITPGSVVVLLEFFISYPHTVWTKTEIGAKAFTNTAYSGSESNVNKSLSLLRRSFKEVGEDSNIIMTLSSQGVAFNASVAAYDEAPLSPVQASHGTSSIKPIVYIGGVLFTMFAIPAFYFINASEPTECTLLTRGNTDEYMAVTKNMKELSNCNAPGIIINGARKFSGIGKNYSMVAVCEQSSQSCLNLIQK